MAQYSEKVYITDSFYTYGTQYSVTAYYGEPLKAESVYNFYTTTQGYSSYEPQSRGTILASLPERIGINKKRCTGYDFFAFVESREYSFNGNLPSGSNKAYAVDGTQSRNQSFIRYMSTDWRNTYLDIVSMATNSYVKLSNNKSLSSHPAITVFMGCTGNVYANTDYFGKISLTVQGHAGKNPPYVIYNYADVIPFASNMFPSKFVDKKIDNTFRWNFDYYKYDVTGTIKQASAKLRYRNKSDTNYTEIAIAGETNTYTIPANTFTANEIEWQVIVTSDDGITSETENWTTLTTIDSAPKCEAVFPNGIFIDGTQNNTFMWDHIIDTGSPQSKYELQYSTDGTTWINLSTESTARESYTVPADTLPAGNLKWRVRT